MILCKILIQKWNKIKSDYNFIQTTFVQVLQGVALGTDYKCASL